MKINDIEIMTKVINWIKNNLRLLEKITLLAGSLLILTVGLVFNIYADTKINITVGYLIYGLLTGIAGGILVLVGLTKNLFDVKIGGLICVGLGVVLSIASILLYPGYLASPLYEALLSDVKSGVKVILILLTVFSIISCLPIACGFASQLYRKIKNIED